MTTIISPDQLKRQKRTLIAFGAFFILLCIIIMGMAVFEERYMLFFTLPICVVLAIRCYKDLKRISSISYDDGTIYYIKLGSASTKKFSFENIRSITVGRFDFTYRINLYTPNEDGPYLYFKYPIFWMPLIFEGKLEQVYELRDKIDACKKSNDEDYTGQTQVLKLTEV